MINMTFNSRKAQARIFEIKKLAATRPITRQDVVDAFGVTKDLSTKYITHMLSQGLLVEDDLKPFHYSFSGSFDESHAKRCFAPEVKPFRDPWVFCLHQPYATS